MHMADALVSPGVGAAMLAVSGALIGYSGKRIKKEADEQKIPLMGVMAAFIFSAQMINFSIPATGSSGHLGGGLILAILLGPFAGFIAIASVLLVQALFFADGGLLALGCNIFNLGFFPCFIAYPFIYKKIAGSNSSRGRVFAGSLAGAVIGLQLGALGVVFQTLLSGVSELPFKSFLLLMQPIHLAIGIAEGLVTAAVVNFVLQTRPEILKVSLNANRLSFKKFIFVLLLLSLIIGSTLSWFASSAPDGLEWAMFKSSGREEFENNTFTHSSLSRIIDKTALLPDYGFKPEHTTISAQAQTSVAGLSGAGITLVVVFLIGLALKRVRRGQNA